MKHLVYKTTNTVNGKFYIGKHSTDEIEDGYLGSGVVLLRAVKKHGKDAFIREVLFEFDDEHAAYECERRVLEEVGLNSELCYNACKGGVGFWKGMRHTAEARAKISASNIGKRRSLETREKMSKSRSGRPISEEAKAKLREVNLGKTHSDDTKAKISVANHGKTRSAEFCEKSSGWMKGRASPRKGVRLSDDTKAKISAAKSGTTMPLDAVEKIRASVSGQLNAGFGKVWITDGVSNARVAPCDTIPDGWRRGRSLRPYQINKGK